jgi:hypothetical protein
MIQLIEGPLGSGKSYFAVNYVFKFTKYDDLYDEYVLAENVLIISNIEGLRIKHWDLDELLKKQTIEQFFSIDNFESIQKKTGKNHVVLLIDECHLLFPAGYKNDGIYAFFAYSRHLGLDIILLTQGIQSTSRMFNPLLEFVVKVTPRSRQVLNNFSFSYITLTGHFLYSKSIAKRQIVFKAYRSFRVDEKQKPKNAILHWVIITCIIFFSAAFLFKTALAIVKGKGEKARVKMESVEKLKHSGNIVNVPSATALSGATPGVAPAAPLPVPVMRPLSSARPSVQVPPVPLIPSLVMGVIRQGASRRYLLANGRFVSCKRVLEVGDIYR